MKQVSDYLEPVPLLSRSIHDPPVTTPDGVDFCLNGRDDKIRCTVTRAALTILSKQSIKDDNYGDIFQAYREDIEAAAAQKYARRKARSRRRLILSAVDIVLHDRHFFRDPSESQ